MATACRTRIRSGNVLRAMHLLQAGPRANVTVSEAVVAIVQDQPVQGTQVAPPAKGGQPPVTQPSNATGGATAAAARPAAAAVRRPRWLSTARSRPPRPNLKPPVATDDPYADVSKLPVFKAGFNARIIVAMESPGDVWWGGRWWKPKQLQKELDWRDEEAITGAISGWNAKQGQG